MDDNDGVWYTITDWAGITFETLNIEDAKEALRNDGAVVKHKRVVFEPGPTVFRMTASTIRDL